jgi:hypothetical protein
MNKKLKVFANYGVDIFANEPEELDLNFNKIEDLRVVELWSAGVSEFHNVQLTMSDGKTYVVFPKNTSEYEANKEKRDLEIFLDSDD